MFSILVQGNSKAWETDQLMRIDRSRFKEFSGTEGASIVLDNLETLKALETKPAFLMYERGCENAEIVRYGFLKDIRTLGHELTFKFVEEGTFDRTTIEEFASRLGMSLGEDCRTHWALKDGGVPSQLLERLRQSYDVVLSFAGEDREYVERVAEALRQMAVKVFYDDFEEVHLWGKHLTEHFDLIYRQNAKYCVMFISKNYAAKPWTVHERRMALARALMQKNEYILPARFDSTELPGVPPTIAYISLSKKNPEDLASLILQKLRGR